MIRRFRRHVTQLEIGGKPHQVLGSTRQTGETVKDLGETGEKPPTVNVNQGSWALEEDQSGKPVLFNAKTGAGHALPSSRDAEIVEQQLRLPLLKRSLHGPGRDALEYADTYMKMGASAWPGDEALMWRSSLNSPMAIRLDSVRSQPQIDMPQETLVAGMNSIITGKAYYAINGTWFLPDHAQRNSDVYDAPAEPSLR